MHITRESSVPPERVRTALTDFSEHRFDIFANLDRRHFEVHRLDDTSAEVTEGAGFLGGIWERIRYDWSEPAVVRLTCLDSNSFTTGSDWEYRLQPTGDGGTRVDLTVRRLPRGIKGGVLVTLLRVAGTRVLGADLAKTLRALERDQGT
jgi:hypothetical protein